MRLGVELCGEQFREGNRLAIPIGEAAVVVDAPPYPPAENQQRPGRGGQDGQCRCRRHGRDGIGRVGQSTIIDRICSPTCKNSGARYWD